MRREMTKGDQEVMARRVTRQRGHFEFDHEQGDRNREHRIGEEHQPLKRMRRRAMMHRMVVRPVAHLLPPAKSYRGTARRRLPTAHRCRQ